ncbi:hypothetical protein [Actinomycetospora atypica]|uniref:Uncharacterized protein n=1 Tax=Actinomycetospora atypica TaxID=1290095 RepID=A0ABV9YIM5_9PSEU
MAQQGTEEQQADSEQQAGDEASGKHRSSEDEQASSGEQSSGDGQASGDGQSSGEQSSSDGQQSSEKQSDDKQSDGQQSSEKQSSDEQPTQKQESAPSEQKTEKHESAASEQKTEKQQTQQKDAPAQQQRGKADTSWAEPEQKPKRSLDVGELAWRTGNVIATVVRTLALLFALVLIVNVVLILVGVNPANGVAQFIGGVADTVILGFRNLFVPSNPTVALIVNSLVAAVFWVFVGELLSRLIRFLAARVK